MEFSFPFWGAKHQNIWYSYIKRRQIDNNLEFFLQVEAVRQKMLSMPRIEATMVQRYRNTIIFHLWPHYISIQQRQDPHHQWLVIEFKLTKEEIDNIVQEWKEEWRDIVVDYQWYAEIDPKR